MKNTLLLLGFFLSFNSIVLAQGRVGSFPINAKHKNLNKKALEKFKNSPVTYFIFDYNNTNYTKGDYEKILKEVWTFTPFKIIEESNVSELFKEGTAYARFQNFRVYSQGRLSSATSSFHYIDFSVIKKITKEKVKNGKRSISWKSNRVAAIYFTPDIPIRQQVVSGKKTFDGDLMNYRLGYLKNYLQFVNNKLENKENFDTFSDYIDKDKIGILKDKTLYFAKNFIYSYSGKKVAMAEKQITEEELFADYEHNYKVISDEEINEKILNGEEFYYMVYHQNAFIKTISIINSKTGDVIYSNAKKLSFNIKPKDVKEISKKNI